MRFLEARAPLSRTRRASINSHPLFGCCDRTVGDPYTTTAEDCRHVVRGFGQCPDDRDLREFEDSADPEPKAAEEGAKASYLLVQRQN